MKSTYRVLFFTRKTRPNKDGLVTIAIRITIDGESIEFNPKLFVNPEIWNPIGRAEGKTKEAREINQALDNVRTDLKNHYNILFEKYGYVTPEKLRNSYLGIDIQQNTILSLLDGCISNCRISLLHEYKAMSHQGQHVGRKMYPLQITMSRRDMI